VEKSFVKSVMTANGIFAPILVVKGRIAGLWKRVEEKERIGIGLQLFDPAGKIPEPALAAAIREYGKFFGKRAERI